MKIEVVKRHGYTMIYNVFEAGVDFDPSDDFITLKCLARYSLHDGYRVWRVGAAYARHMKPTFYYVAATNKVAAMNKFLSIAPWLNVIASIVPLDEAGSEMVLGNPAKFILW